VPKRSGSSGPTPNSTRCSARQIGDGDANLAQSEKPSSAASQNGGWPYPDPLCCQKILSHLQDFTASGEDALVFTGPKNAQLRRSNFSKAWRDATKAANLTDFHFHDLRHTGNTLAGAAGASLRELVERLGHSTTRAALIYQHRTSERDKLIADAMGKLAKAELRQRGRPSGTQRARKGKPAS
jgi:hypothetical protein